MFSDVIAIEIGSVDQISSLMGNQAIGWIDSTEKRFKTLSTCSYSEYNGQDGTCKTCGSGYFPETPLST
jgi:hypothetical protein